MTLSAYSVAQCTSGRIRHGASVAVGSGTQFDGADFAEPRGAGLIAVPTSIM